MNTTMGARPRVDPVEPVHVQPLERLLKVLCGDVADAVVLESVGSSNQYLLEAPPHDPQRPRVAWALAQPQGRGRRGRAWVGVPRHSLMISMSFTRAPAPAGAPPAHSLAGLPIAIGLALVRALSPWAPDLRLKWPNDLQRGGRKCAGLLIEVRQRAGARPLEQVVLGFGLNLFVAGDMAHVGQPACGLFDREHYPPRATIAARLVRAFADAWRDFQNQGLNGVIAQWPRWDALAGQPVVVLDGDRVLLEGTACGIAPSGALCIDAADGRHEISYGDVSVRVRKPG